MWSNGRRFGSVLKIKACSQYTYGLNWNLTLILVTDWLTWDLEVIKGSEFVRCLLCNWPVGWWKWVYSHCSSLLACSPPTHQSLSVYSLAPDGSATRQLDKKLYPSHQPFYIFYCLLTLTRKATPVLLFGFYNLVCIWIFSWAWANVCDSVYLVASIVSVPAAEVEGWRVRKKERRTKYYYICFFPGRIRDWFHMFRTKSKKRNRNNSHRLPPHSWHSSFWFLSITLQFVCFIAQLTIYNYLIFLFSILLPH